MRAIGRKDQLFGGSELRPVTPDVRMRFTRPDLTPTCFPRVPDGQSLVCGLDTLLDGEQLIVCESFEDMQWCDARYGSGIVLAMRWYFVTVVDANQN